IGVFRKSDGFQEAAFTFNTFMSQGAFGNLCDTNNFGDPVVLYDTFEDRWIITDFAFLTDISNNVLAPAYPCFAASMNGNPFTGPDVPIAATSWPAANVANAAQPGTATLLDVLQLRAMVQNQYTNFGGTESLWLPHTVRRANTTGFAAPRWYQVNVTGGTVAASIPQAATWDPNGANVIQRFMPSLAL